MADSIGIKLALEGESEFKKSLKDINSSFKVLGSEMKLVTSGFDENEKSAESLTARNQVLGKEIDLQKSKIQTLSSALDNASASFGENDKRTQSWQIQLNNAKAELNQLEREADKNGKAIDELSESEDEATSSSEKLSKGISDTGKSADDAENRFVKFKNTLATVTKVLAATVAAVGAATVAAGKAVFDMADSTASLGDEIDKNSQKIGISAESYQEWAYVFERSGADIDGLKTGMKTLSTVIADAATGSDSAQEKLKAVGLSIKDLQGKSTDKQLSLVISALQKMKSGAERTAAANDLLGKSGTDMAAVLNMDKEATEALIQEAHIYGMVMSDEAVKSSAGFKDSLTRLSGSFSGLKNNIAADLLPSITQVMDGLSDMMVGLEDSDEKLKEGTSALIDELGSSIPRFMSMVSRISGAVLESSPAILKALGDGLIATLPSLSGTVMNIVSSILSSAQELFPSFMEAGVSIILSLSEGLSDRLPEIITEITSMLTSLVQTIIDNLPLFASAAVQIMAALAKGLVDSLPSLLQSIPSILLSIVKAFGTIVEQMKEVGKNLVKGLWNGIQSMASWLTDSVKSWCSSLWSTIKGTFGIASPSKKMAWAGQMLSKGLAEGIDETSGLAVTAAEDMESGVLSSFSSLGRNLKGAIPEDFSFRQNITRGLSSDESVYSSSGILNVTIPLTMDGKVITKVVSQVLYDNNAAYARNLGTT